MNDSPEFRRECEAREVMKWPKEQRVAHYQAIKEIRGQKAADELVAEVKRQHQLQEKRTAELSL